ncbi:SRPBCC family protein [Sporosarcina sp. ACRSM]|uniref:CoxG family protein n=1 Tax=Sporosarcina sp. ACRSM TaxID=2918216 RepID=UPI001EF5F49D|nr:SRPBCC family protein [Sporosarcina sp. ACRSM]MCG7333747.1 SRPBCC family protein [Sporosarcina sp. ACRSM]
MAIASHSVNIPASVENVWAYVSQIENWATMVPAYKEHEQIDEQKSIWTFEGEFKGLKKTVKMELDITEFHAPSTIRFELKGLTDNFTGSGQFTAEESAEHTTMTGTVEVNAGGLSGAVLAPVLKMVLPKVTTRLTEKIARQIKQDKVLV